MTLKGCHCPDVIKKWQIYSSRNFFSNRIGVCNAYVVSFLEKKIMFKLGLIDSVRIGVK